MTLVKFVTFVVFKILNNLVFMQNFLNAHNCRRKQNFENYPTQPYLYLNVLSESSIHFYLAFNSSWLKRMFAFSHKMVFIENEAALLCVTMRERARIFGATV